jgi:hypothetical protein
VISDKRSDKNSLFHRGSVREMGLCVKGKDVTTCWGLGLSGCAGDCEGCDKCLIFIEHYGMHPAGF